MSRTTKIKNLIETLSSEPWTDADRDFLVYTLLVRKNEIKALNAILDNAEDRLICNEAITRAVQLVKGKGSGAFCRRASLLAGWNGRWRGSGGTHV